jgi:hypothetical protein
VAPLAPDVTVAGKNVTVAPGAAAAAIVWVTGEALTDKRSKTYLKAFFSACD